jgi:hypothetical protein
MGWLRIVDCQLLALIVNTFSAVAVAIGMLLALLADERCSFNQNISILDTSIQRDFLYYESYNYSILFERSVKSSLFLIPAFALMLVVSSFFCIPVRQLGVFDMIPPPPSPHGLFAQQQGNSFAPGYCTTATECSMGLTDYGITNTGSTYNYYAYMLESTTTFTKLLIPAIDSGISLQLNSVALNVLENSNYGDYWVQNVAAISQTGSVYTIEFLNNIWNFTGNNPYSPGMSGSVWGCGTVGSRGTFYGCGGPVLTTSLPFKIVLEETSSIGTGSQTSQPCVTFLYQLWHGTKELGHGSYDKVCFEYSYPQVVNAPTFVVGGSNGYTYNALSNVITSYCCGQIGGVSSAAATMKLQYDYGFNGHFSNVLHAWSEGDTGETLSGVHMGANTINHQGIATTGTDNQVELW